VAQVVPGAATPGRHLANALLLEFWSELAGKDAAAIEVETHHLGFHHD
jgi:hypothetical protein